MDAAIGSLGLGRSRLVAIAVEGVPARSELLRAIYVEHPIHSAIAIQPDGKRIRVRHPVDDELNQPSNAALPRPASGTANVPEAVSGWSSVGSGTSVQCIAASAIG